jgi:hypothetical protein
MSSERVLLERLQRVPIERRHEDHRRHGGRLETTQDLEAVDFRHLYVQEQHVRALPADRVDGVRAVAALGDDREVLLAREEQPQRLPRERLVVHHDRPPRACRRAQGHDGA